MVKGTVKGKGSTSSADPHSATSTARRITRLEGLVDELVGAAFSDKLGALSEKISNEIMEREVQDKVLLTYIKTLQVQPTAPSQAGSPTAPQSKTAQSSPPCSVAEAAELSAQQEVVRAQLFAFSQVFQRDLASVQRAVNELKERVEAAADESPKAMRAAAEKVAESSVRALEQQAAEASKGIQSIASPRQGTCTPAQVKQMVSEALVGARSEWKAALDVERANNGERKAELGRVLVKEFERSIVGHHAERLAAAEEKLKTLRIDLDMVKDGTNGPEASSYYDARVTTEDGTNTNVQRVALPNSRPEDSDGDVDPLQVEMTRLVSVVQGLQLQSEQVMGMLEQSKTALQKEVQIRMREDQRIEESCHLQISSLKESLNGGIDGMMRQTIGLEQSPQSAGSPSPSAIRSHLQEIISKVDGKSLSEFKQEDSPDNVTSLAEAHTYGTDSNTQSLSLSSDNSLKPGDPAHLVVEDLRTTILTYFRSEFQDYVGETLQKLGTSSRSGTPQPPAPQSPIIKIRQTSPLLPNQFGMATQPSPTSMDLLSSVQSIQQSPLNVDLLNSVKSVPPPTVELLGSIRTPPMSELFVKAAPNTDGLTQSQLPTPLGSSLSSVPVPLGGSVAHAPTPLGASVTTVATPGGSIIVPSPQKGSSVQSAAASPEQIASTLMGATVRPPPALMQENVGNLVRVASPLRSISADATAERAMEMLHRAGSVKVSPRPGEHVLKARSASADVKPEFQLPGKDPLAASLTMAGGRLGVGAGNMMLQPGAKGGVMPYPTAPLEAMSSSTLVPPITGSTRTFSPSRQTSTGTSPIGKTATNTGSLWNSPVQVAAAQMSTPLNTPRQRSSTTPTLSGSAVRQASYPFQVQLTAPFTSPHAG